MGRKKIYQTEEERLAARREAALKSYHKNKEKYSEYRKEYNKQYKQEHKEELSEKEKEYRKTPMGRASYLLKDYKRHDKEKNRGKCTLTTKWIIEHIFTQKCAHCPETDWRELGCNRLDNSLPHTPDNVEPCCERCNKKLSGRPKKTLRADEMTL